MPSRLHQTLSELFLNHPPLAAELLTEAFGLNLPAWQVLGAEQVPVVSDPVRAAACPELAVLSAVAHGARPRQWRPVVEAAWVALQAVDRDHFDLYADIVHSALSGAPRRYLEDLMNVTVTEPLSPLFRPHWLRGRDEGRDEGRAEGEARAVLAFLEARGIEVPDAARERINACTDLDQLDAWVRRAVTINSVDELFTE